MTPTLSVIIPARNEAVRLGATLNAMLSYLNRYKWPSELIVVDDGSSDETPQVAEESFASAGDVSVRLICNTPNRGKGHAVRTGLLAARALVALFSDADLSTPITELPKLVDPLLRRERDVVFGSRQLDRSLIGVHQSWRRELGGRCFNAVVRLVTGLPVRDTQCGFKAFRMSTCRPVVEAATIDRFGFDVELLYVAALAGLRMRECAVRWDHNDGSTVSLFRDSLRMFSEVRLIRKQAAAGLYDLAIRQARERAAMERRSRPATRPSERLLEQWA